jgi:hypothetical protein
MMRRAEVVARMIADQGRISPHRKRHIQANLMQLMGDMGLGGPGGGEDESGFRPL